MASRRALQWLFLVAGLMVPLGSSQAKRTICLPQPSQSGVYIPDSYVAGDFRKVKDAEDFASCLKKACDEYKKGNIAILFEKNSVKTCYSYICNSKDSCKLEKKTEPGIKIVGSFYRVIAPYPSFKNVPKVINIREDTAVDKGVIITLNVTAQSRKRDRETMGFEIAAGNIGRTFRLHSKRSNHSVSVQLRKHLDREKIPAYHLQIRATNTVENVSTWINITINITDVNDNPPVFMKSLFIFSVFGNMSEGTILGRLIAKDNDTGENAMLTYGMMPPSDLITLDPASGVVTLKKKRQVDQIETFDYNITATDERYPSKARLKVELYPNNIKRPKFAKQSYKVWLNGQASINTEVVQIRASDPDFGKLGELTFLITNGNEDGSFSITSEGKIRTQNNIPPERDAYNLTINVHDNGYPELYAVKPVHVVISVQWLRFKEGIYDVTVREDFPLTNTVLTANASFWDGGIEEKTGQRQRTDGGINYYLNDIGQFNVEEDTGVITLRRHLDYERRQLYELVLRAYYECPNSTAKSTNLTAKAILRLQVTDVNDNPPKFSRLFYSQDIWKSSKKNSPVLSINATDADGGRNGQIQFDVISGNINDSFSFESNGLVFLRKSLRHTQVSTFNITVEARDNGEPPLRSAAAALVSIHVRGERRAPVFLKSSYSAMVSEAVPINTEIVRVKATVEKVETAVTYWIRNFKSEIPFRIDSSSGWIFTTRGLDREKKDQYVLTVVANAGESLFSIVNVTITLNDENDNPPVFTRPYYFTVLKSHRVGTPILKVKATDKDQGRNAKIIYSITRGADMRYFSINSSAGMVVIGRPIPKKSLRILKLFVSARDQGRTPQSSPSAALVIVRVDSTFPIHVESLEKSATAIKLRFTMTNVSLHNVSHIGIVVQESDSIVGYEEVTKRPLKSWFYIHNGKGNGAYAQRYLTGRVECTDLIRKTKTFDFTVGTDGDTCSKNKNIFCNGKLQANKKYRFQLVAYFKNGSLLENVTNVESKITEPFPTEAYDSKRTAGFRTWHYDIIVIVLSVLVGLIIIATVVRAIILYRRDKERMKKEDAKDGISYPLSNPRYRRSGEHTPSSRSTISFTELSKSRKNDKKADKVSPCETEKLQMGQDETGGVSRDSGCGVSVKSSNSDINHRRTSSVRQAFFSFGKKNKGEEEEEDEETSDKEIETELNS